jgi:hypothetical protein
MRNWMPAMRRMGSDQLMIESRSVLNRTPVVFKRQISQTHVIPTEVEESLTISEIFRDVSAPLDMT